MTPVLEAERPASYLRRLAASEFGRAYKSLVVDELRLEPGATVADLGCGPGTDLGAFAAAVGPKGRVVGIDSDEEAIGQAVAGLSDRANVALRVGDIHAIDLPDRSIDRVHTDRVLQHVADPDQVLREVARVLRPGGLVALAEPDWGTLVIDFPEPATPDAYRTFITDRVVRNARIGRALPNVCERAGLHATRVVPITAVFRDVAEADRVFGFRRVSTRAVHAGYLTGSQRDAWLEHLRTKPFFASMSLFVTVATRSCR